jgi:hypothetical protein
MHAGSESRDTADETPHLVAGGETWYVIHCPSSVVITSVDKERSTQGVIYCIWNLDSVGPVWVGQSIPALIRSINEKAIMEHEKRLHASSAYRCLRGESRTRSHKGHGIERFSRNSLEALNTFLRSFTSAVYVSKSPEYWHCTDSTEDGEE